MASLVGDANRRSQQLRVAAVASEINVGSQKTFPDGVDRLQVEQLHEVARGSPDLSVRPHA